MYVILLPWSVSVLEENQKVRLVEVKSRAMQNFATN